MLTRFGQEHIMISIGYSSPKYFLMASEVWSIWFPVKDFHTTKERCKKIFLFFDEK